MARLTENEILDRLKSSLKSCIDYADRLANGERGPIYPRFAEHMKLIYGCTRQMGGFREDSRWLPFGLQVMEAKERCRRWLVEKGGPDKFRKLAERLRAVEAAMNAVETKRTGRRGMILPEMLKPETRTQGRSIIVPPGFRDIRERTN